MSKSKKPVIAICYDFDGTLSPGNMQEYDYIPRLKIKPKVFWGDVKKLAKKQDADEILVYMDLMIEKADRKVEIRKGDFINYGKKVKLFKGVNGWFRRINKYGTSRGANIEHFVISSGIKEMIQGTKIFGYFKKVYASSFIYDQHGVAIWPGLAINYTTKTQFLFRINKGYLEVSDNRKINKFVAKDKRPVPFSRVIYMGDGSTDVPCMSLVKDQGGYSVAVYKPRSGLSKLSSKELKKYHRVDFIAAADYRAGKAIDVQIKKVIDKIMADYNLQQ
jgi:hypothetical protein